MAQSSKSNLPAPFLPIAAGIFAWCIPGAGHWIIGEKKRAMIIFVSLMLAYLIGLFLGSIAVIEIKSPWFYAQILFSPISAYIGHLSGSVLHLESFGRPREIGEIYTGIAGMMNLLCIVNAVYLAHKKNQSA